jgi:peptide/nickel transport system substrate-binding protein
MNLRYSPFREAFITLIFVGLLSAGCQPNKQAPTLRYGLTLSPSGLDPHINASAELGIPLHSVYDTLIVRDPDTGEFLPSLAMAWHVSADGRVYTFNLRQDVAFHDGTPFDAYAAAANFDYVVNPEHHSQKAAAMLGPFKKAEAVDEYSLQIHLNEPFSPLLDSLSQVYLGMASPSALEQWGPSEYQFHQVGTGPFRFVEFIPNDHIILERFEDYAWGPAVYQNETAKIERVEFQFYEDTATRALALERGEVDILGEIPPQDAIRLSSTDEFSLMVVPIPGQPLEFFFNTDLSPTDDLLVRRALLASVDRQRIVETLFGDLSPVSMGPLSEQFFEAIVPDEGSSESQSPVELLEIAGWLDSNEDGIRSKAQKDLTINLISPPWGSNPEVAQLIKVDWESIGVKVNLEIASSFGTLKQIETEGQYHAIGLNFFGTDPDLLRPFYVSNGVYNWSKVQSLDLDHLLGDAAREIDMSIRNSLYRQAIAQISEQALVLPIRDYVNLIVHANTISNLHFSAQGWFPYLIDLELES